jgi:hypothetical protein
MIKECTFFIKIHFFNKKRRRGTVKCTLYIIFLNSIVYRRELKVFCNSFNLDRFTITSQDYIM